MEKGKPKNGNFGNFGEGRLCHSVCVFAMSLFETEKP